MSTEAEQQCYDGSYWLSVLNIAVLAYSEALQNVSWENENSEHSGL